MHPHDFLHFVIWQLVQYPEQIRIEDSFSSEDRHIFLIHADPMDIPLLIGKRGKTIESLRVLIHILSMKLEKKLYIRLIEGEKLVHI